MVNVAVASQRRGRLTTSNESNKRQHVRFWPVAARHDRQKTTLYGRSQVAATSHQPSLMNDWFPLRELQCDQGKQAQNRPDIRMQSH